MSESTSGDTVVQSSNAKISVESEPENENQTALPLAPAAHGLENSVAPAHSPEAAATDAEIEGAPSATEIAGSAPGEIETDAEPEETPAFYYGPVGKRRSRAAVIALCLVTFGLYGLIWHNRNNSELADFDPQMRVHPGRSTWAVAIPWLLGLAVTLVGAARIILSNLQVTLPFDPHFSVNVAYFLLAGLLTVQYLTLLLPFSVTAVVMTAERVRIVEECVGIGSDVQIRPASTLALLLIPLAGPVMLISGEQRRINAAWERISPQGRRRRR